MEKCMTFSIEPFTYVNKCNINIYNVMNTKKKINSFSKILLLLSDENDAPDSQSHPKHALNQMFMATIR